MGIVVNIMGLDVLLGTLLGSMGLVKFKIPDPLHRRVKTCAAYHDKKIPDYIVDVLEEHVPREITFDESAKKKPKAEKSAP